MESRNKAFIYFVKFGFRYKKRIVLYFIAMMLYSAFKAFPFYLLKNFLHVLFSSIEKDFSKILSIVLAIAGCGIGIGIFSYFYRYLGQYLSIKAGIDITNRIYAHLTELPLSFFKKQEKGDLITKLTYDASCTAHLLQKLFVQLIPKPIEFIGFVIICFTLSWHLALLFFLIIPAIAYIVKHFGGKITHRSKKAKEILSESTVTMEQFFSGIKLIKSFHSQKREENKFRHINKKFLKAKMGIARVHSRSLAFIELFGTWFLAGLIALGSFIVAKRYINLSAEHFMAFLGALAASLNPIRMTGQHMMSILRESPSPVRLYELLQVESDINVPEGAVSIESIEPGIVFKNVRFSYEDKEVIKGISLEIKPGEMVAFVGPSGGGKTTLLDLIPRFYDIDSGSLHVGGEDIKNIKQGSLMSKIAIVLQDSFIFNNSALENIRYGLPDASFEEVEKAAKQANVHDMIEELPEKYDTFLGEEGAILSGGQKQRISIARALLKGAPILIMDEPTSELDSESEKLIMDTIRKIRQDKILLIIAHRLSTVLNSDRIVVINNGEIESMGKHEELINDSPTYKRMYEIQFDDNR